MSNASTPSTKGRRIAAYATVAAILLVASGILIMVVRTLEPADSDTPLRAHFTRHRAGFQQLCEAFPRLGVLAVGRAPGRLTLSHTGATLFHEPSPAELEAAGLTSVQFDAVVAALSELEVLEVAFRQGRVSFIMRVHGISPSGSSTELICGPPPLPLVGGSSYRGHACRTLAPGWWICDRWN